MMARFDANATNSGFREYGVQSTDNTECMANPVSCHATSVNMNSDGVLVHVNATVCKQARKWNALGLI